MEISRQQAGDNSVQISAAGNVNIAEGVSEERANEIAAFHANGVAARLSHEAADLALTRLQAFDRTVVETLSRMGRLGALGDPSVRIMLESAQRSAVGSDRPGDYDILADLIATRAEGNDGGRRADLEFAVEAVNRLDDDALRGLTVFVALQIRPWKSFSTNYVFGKMNELISAVLDGPLPTGADWVDQLDLVRAARASSGGSLAKAAQYFPNCMPWMVTKGLDHKTDDRKAVLSLMEEHGIQHELPLDEHEFKPGFRRIALTDPQHFSSFYKGKLGDDQILVMTQLARDYYGYIEVENELRKPFMDLWDRHDSLRVAHDWWDQLPAFRITGVGRAIAIANIRRMVPEDLVKIV